MRLRIMSIWDSIRASMILKKSIRQLNKKYPQFKIGKCTYGVPRILFLDDSTKVEIGAYCSIAENVTIFLGLEHRTDWVSTYPLHFLYKSAQHIKGHPRTKGDVIIGNDVWIGYGATILSGVTIGDGAVIGAQSVVAKDVAPYALVAGNPAKEIRRRFTDDIINRLLKCKWWQLDDEQISSIAPMLLSNDVQSLLSFLESQ